MISLTVLGVITAGTSVYLADLEKTRYRMEAMSTRDTLSLRLKRLSTISIVTWSAENLAVDDQGNDELSKCIFGLGDPCTVTSATQPRSFILGYPVSQTNTRVRVAGSEANPVKYCHDGGPLSEAKKCHAEWQAIAYFSAICPLGQPTCKKASAIRISYKLENIYLKDEKFFTRIQKRIAGQGLRSGDNGVFTIIEVPQEIKKTAKVCNPNSAISKVDDSGKVTCTCLPGSIQNGMVNNQPNCEPFTEKCPPGQIATGFRIDTQNGAELKAICQGNTHTVASRPIDQFCPGYLNGLNLSGCTYTNFGGKKKGSGGTQTSCGPSSETCVTPTSLAP